MDQPNVPSSQARNPRKRVDLSKVTPELEHAVGVTLDSLTNILLLDNLKGFGPQKFKAIHYAGLEPANVLANPNLLPIHGKRGNEFRSAILQMNQTARENAKYRAGSQMIQALKNSTVILTYSHPKYPRRLYESNLPLPVLFVRGTLDALATNAAVACVGSRKIRPPYIYQA